MKKIEVLARVWLGMALLLLIGSVAATTITSCGGSSSSSNGGLCEQCGQTDGPCQDTAAIVPGSTEPQACPVSPEPGPTCVEVNLICRRKSDSAQQRCYPVPADNPDATDNPDFGFRCDGARPGGTALPEPTLTMTPSPAATASTCGNGVLDSGEECDGTIFNGAQTCATFCTGGGGVGTLQCTNCVINTANCAGTCSR